VDDGQILQLMTTANDRFKSLKLHFEALQSKFDEVTKKVTALEKNLIEQGKQISDNDNQIRHIQEFHGIPKEEETE